MPLYEYQCSSCGKQFEKRVSFSEADKNPECPECRSADTRKKISLFATSGVSAGSSGYSGAGCSSTGGFT